MSLYEFSDDGVPESKIVFDEMFNDNSNYKVIAYKLYLKYIRTGSEFEINISGRLRRRCDEIMDISKNPKSNSDELTIEFLKLFNRCNNANLQLMKGSLFRFRLTVEYQELKKLVLL